MNKVNNFIFILVILIITNVIESIRLNSFKFIE